MMTLLKSKQIAWVGLLSIALSLPLASQAFAYSENATDDSSIEMKHKRMGQKQLKMMKKKLDLTDEQVDKIKLIKEQSKAEVLTLKEQFKQFKDNAKALNSNPIFDEKAFNDIYSQYQETFAQLALQKAKTKHAIFHVLTAEQQEKWAELKQSKRGKRKGR